MPKLKVNDKEIEFQSGMTVLQACEIAGEEVPRFCYHERLKISGNCRMCLVEIKGGPPKPAASCAMPAGENMEVYTNSPMVKKAREGVMEFLLANHPLDCPICDQGGECDLQDQSIAYGRAESRYCEDKRAVKEKFMGPVIKTQMTRCIHCTRCIRFMEDIAGVPELGAINRGEKKEITTCIEKGLSSELSGNIVDLCPVGALTSRPYTYRARPWELTKTESIDVSDAVGSNIRVDSKGNEVMRILPRLNEEINEEWISDKARFMFEGLKYQRLDKAYIRNDGKLEVSGYDATITKAAEFLGRYKSEEIAFLTGDLTDCETQYNAKKLADTMGIRHIDSREVGNRVGEGGVDKNDLLFNSKIENIDNADYILLIATNPRYEASIVNVRIRKAVIDNYAVVEAINSEEFDLTYKYNFLGNDISVINQLLDDSSAISQNVAKAKNPLIIVGEDLFRLENSHAAFAAIKALAIKYKVINETSNNLSVLHKNASSVGGLLLGFIAKEGTFDTKTVFEATKDSRIKLLVSFGFDNFPAHFDKDSGVKIVYIGHNGDKCAHLADVILPAAAYTEKEALYINTEGRTQSTRRAVFPLGEAKEDYKIVADIAKKLGHNISGDLAVIRSKLADDYAIMQDKFVTVSPVSTAVADFSDKTLKETKVYNKTLNFYLSNILSRVSPTLIKCNEEFGEQKGFFRSKCACASKNTDDSSGGDTKTCAAKNAAA